MTMPNNLENKTENTTENTAEDMTEDMTENTTKNMTEDKTEDTTEDTTEEMTEDMAEDTTDYMAEKMTESATEIPNVLSENRSIRNISRAPRAPARRRSGPKMFYCTGYAGCEMVFTRQEHLNRHIRKHTGVKPYKCIIEGCNRMFTRNDNMRQHADRCPYKNPGSFAKKRTKRAKSEKPKRALPRTNPKRTTKRYKYSSEENSSSSHETVEEEIVQESRTLPPLFYPPPARVRVTPQVIFSSHERPFKHIKPPGFSTNKPGRRLSTQELFGSIDRLEDFNNSSNSEADEGVDLTEDEYEALIAFREFHRAAVTM